MIKVFHTNEDRGNKIEYPIFATGNNQWLGDAYYFWQDYEFAEEWGNNRICKSRKYRKGELTNFDIYEAFLDMEYDSNFVIDTVFNEYDYNKFVENIEKFSLQYEKRFRKKPTLEEFNDFTVEFGIWNDIKAIRFQDLPTKSERDYLKVKGFFYKKRIQIAVYDFNLIKQFKFLKNFKCK